MTAIAITPLERADILSQLAKGFRVDQIASSLKVPSAAVISIRSEHGTDLGALAKAAEDARHDVAAHPGLASIALDDTQLMLQKAGAFPKLAAKATKVTALLAEIREGFEAAEKAAKLAAIIARREQDLADAKRQLAELTGKKPAVKKSAGVLTEAAQIRAWAAVNGHVVAERGVISPAIRDAWKAAQK